jgi:hypothetical protein
MCACFDGYTGTACARAACPNDCSGHGTCESIKEFAEMASFDTHAAHEPTARAAASNNHPDFSSSVGESFSYDLWDADKTMGCKCDPGFYGADCSLKKCAYGLDPLFYDNQDGVITQTTVVHLGSASHKITDEILCADCVNSLAGNVLTVSLSMLSSGLAIGEYIAVTGATCTASNTNSGQMRVAGLTQTTITIEANHGCVITGSVTARLDRLSTKARSTTTGTFRIIFFDIFGEKYVTKPISAADATLTPAAVVSALQSLPNHIIMADNSDVTNTAPDALTVAMHIKTGTHTEVGGIGAGTSGSATKAGLGLGTIGSSLGVPSGPELTITFTNNPGILRSIELDTEGVTNPGGPDYWVANARQGQFSSRYTTNLGRVRTLDYGSTRVWTNSDLTGSVTHGTTSASLVKIGGQEFRVAGSHAYYLTLSEPYLGASIVSELIDTGVTVGGGGSYVAISTPCTNCALSLATNALGTTGTDMTGYSDVEAGYFIEITRSDNAATCVATIASISSTTITLNAGHTCTDFSSPVTGAVKVGTGFFTAAVASGASAEAARVGVLGMDAVTAADFVTGASLSAGGCSFVTTKMGIAAAPPADVTASGTEIGGEHFGCYPSRDFGAFSVSGTIVYRRADDSTNQNLYMAPSDTGTTATSNLMVERGSAKAYLVTAQQNGGDNTVTSYSDTIGAEKFGLGGAGTAPTVNDPVFVNGYGPMTISGVGAAAGQGFSANDIRVEDAHKFFPASFSSATYPIHIGITSNSGNDGLIQAGSVLLINGRRYRVRARGTAASGTVSPEHKGIAYVGLSETYAGNAIEKLCDRCIASVDTNGGLKTHNVLSSVETDGPRLTVNKYDRLMLDGFLHEDYAVTVRTAITDQTSISTSYKGARGVGNNAITYLSVSASSAASSKLSLFRTNVGAGGVSGVTVVSEGANAKVYQYVAQCSNRGLCNSETGLCECFSGYTRHNCDKANAFAI